jgi:hypothetical protein
MSVHIFKVDRESDRYVVWTTTTDWPLSPESIGTRAEILALLTPHEDYPGDTEERLARADVCGTSAQWSWSDGDGVFGPPYFGSWDDPEPLSTQEDPICRAELGAFLTKWLERQ